MSDQPPAVEALSGELDWLRQRIRELEAKEARTLRVEQALKLSEQLYWTLLEQAPVSIIIFDQDGVIQFVNDYHIKKFAGDKVGKDYYLGAKITELPRTVRSGIGPDLRLILEGRAVELSDVFVPEFIGGKPGYVNVRGAPLFHGDQVVGGILIQEDITVLKEAETAIVRAKEQWERTFDAAPDLIAVIAPDYRILRLNLAMAERLNLTPQEAVGRKCYELIHGTGQPPDFCPHARSMADMREHSIEVFEPRLDGCFLVTTSPLFEINGTLAGSVHVARDITAIKKGEEALRSAHAELNQIFETAADGMRIIDADFNVLRVNETFVQLSGVPREEAVGKKCYEVFSDSSCRTPDCPLPRILNGEERIEADVDKKRPDGSAVSCLMTAKPLKRPDGEIVGMVADYKDLTARKRLEEQLSHSQKMEAMGRLAGGVAHDFNNLLSAIIGYSELILLKLDQKDPVRRDVEQIHRAGIRAADLTRQLLAFSRKQRLEPRLLDLNAVITDMKKILLRVIGEDIKLTTRLDRNLGLVQADPGQIEQVIMNLAVNARDAMPQGGNLAIETGCTTLSEENPSALPPGTYVTLTVSDTGLGMDPETQSHIFEPFFTTKDPGKGTGLGLATVYGVVKQSGGDISVTSAPGQGTTFRIYLPRVEATVAAFQEELSEASSWLGRETVLLVEDEEMVRNLAAEVLKKNGYTVLVVSNPGEALLLAERHPEPIHLVLADVVMPLMNGPELAGRISRLRPKAQVLFMSGYADETLARHGLLEADAACVHKPFTQETLVRKIREILDGLDDKRGGAAVRSSPA